MRKSVSKLLDSTSIRLKTEWALRGWSIMGISNALEGHPICPILCIKRKDTDNRKDVRETAGLAWKDGLIIVKILCEEFPMKVADL